MKHKLYSFAISSFYAGVAGGLWTYYMTIINPEAFQLSTSIDYIAMIIVGGMGTFLGPVFGAIFVVLLPEAIQRTMEICSLSSIWITPSSPSNRSSSVSSSRSFSFFEPKGLAEIVSRLYKRVRHGLERG